MQTLVLILDLAGTFVFALAGAIVGARRQLDIFGVLASAFVTDVLLAQVPTVLRSDLYAVAALAGAIVVVVGERFSISPITAPTRAQRRSTCATDRLIRTLWS